MDGSFWWCQPRKKHISRKIYTVSLFFAWRVFASLQTELMDYEYEGATTTNVVASVGHVSPTDDEIAWAVFRSPKSVRSVFFERPKQRLVTLWRVNLGFFSSFIRTRCIDVVVCVWMDGNKERSQDWKNGQSRRRFSAEALRFHAKSVSVGALTAQRKRHFSSGRPKNRNWIDLSYKFDCGVTKNLLLRFFFISQWYLSN